MKNLLLIIGVIFSLNLHATTRYVKQGGTGNGSSWAQASGDLQLMINQSSSGDEVHVGSGIYFPNRKANNLGVITPNDRNNAFVLKSNVTIKGSYISIGGVYVQDYKNYPSVLSGNIGDPNWGGDNCYHVVIAAGWQDNATLQGFTISNGTASGSSSITVNSQSIESDKGGGLCCVNSYPDIIDCTFSDNWASKGGALYITSAGVHLTMINCVFYSNNAAWGGGVYIKTSTAVNSIFNSCVFNKNKAIEQSSPNFRYNMPTWGGFGGGFYIETGYITLNNCTLASNDATNTGGGVYQESQNQLTLKNSIVWSNTAYDNPGIYRAFNHNTACFVQNNPALNINPQFVNVNSPLGSDGKWRTSDDGLKLVGCSLGRNAGINSDVPGSNTYDIAGYDRILNEIVDIGAYEHPNTVNVTMTGSHTTCGLNNGSVTANPTGGSGYTYYWNTSGNTQTLTNLAPGNYSVTVTASGCTNSATASFTVNPSQPLTATVTPTHTTCGLNNGSATANPSGGSGYTYAWSNGATTQNISGLAAGNYMVTVTSSGGCTATATTTINSSTGITTTAASTHTTCGLNNGSATANPSGGSGYAYAWSNGATTQNISGLAAGDYKVTVTAADGCTAIATATINSSSGINANITTSDESCNSCQNGSATVDPEGGADYTYIWSNGATSQTIINLIPGVYTVTVTASNGCTATATATVNAFGCPPININPSYSDPVCAGECNGQVSVSPTGGQEPYSYSWSNGKTTATLSGLCEGFYSVTITDALGCFAQESFPLINPQYLSVFTNSTDVTTPGGSDGKITLDIWGGVPPYTYLWSTGATGSEILNLTAGLYTVTVTDANGCSTIKEAIITDPDCSTVNIVLGEITHASGPDVHDGSIRINVTGGTEPYTFQWFLNGVIISADQDLYSIAPGSYTVVVTDASGCIAGGGAYTVSTTSATSNLEKNGIRLFPNPASNILNLVLSRKTNVNIYNIAGIRVQSFRGEKGENRLDIGNLLPGMYCLEAGGYVIRFVKQ